jgi:hypothetical protein
VGDLADEERVARSGGAHAPSQRRSASGRCEDRRDVALGERPQRVAGNVVAPRQAGHDVAEQGRAARLGVAVGGQHEQPHGSLGAQQVLQVHQREIVGPVQIVEHKQHGPRCARGLQQRCGGLQRAQPLNVGLGGRRFGQTRQPRGELRQQRDQIAGMAAELDAQLVDRAGGSVRTQRLSERLRGSGEAVVAAPVKHHAFPLARVAGHLGRQARLADSGLAAEEDATTTTPGSVVPRRPQSGELGLAPGQRGPAVDEEGHGEGNRDPAPRGPSDRPGAHRLQEIAQRQLARVLELDVGSRPGEQAHRIGDENARRRASGPPRGRRRALPPVVQPDTGRA